jgi:midasin
MKNRLMVMRTLWRQNLRLTEGEGDSRDEYEGVTSSRADEAAVDNDNIVPSDVQGLGNENGQEAGNEEKGLTWHNKTKDQQATLVPRNSRKLQQTKVKPRDRPEIRTRSRKPEEVQENQEMSGFRKLGDALERWHRQQRQIREAAETEERQETKPQEVDATDADFEHLPSEGAHADAQALGGATEDQAQVFDESEVVDSEDKQPLASFCPR